MLMLLISKLLNNMDPIVGGAIVGGVSNLIGNLFGSNSTKNTNQTNLRIAQMNNEWSERMMQKQMDYNTLMWNEQNEYNDPSKQVERLKKAGINPALALSSISTGSAQGASSPSLPSPSGATMQSFRPDFSGIASAAMQALSMEMMQQKNAAEVNNLNAQADVARARAAADNAWTYERLKETRVGRQFLEATYDIRKAQVGEDYMNTIRQGRNIEAQQRLAVSQDLLNQKELAIFDSERAAGVANSIADTLLKLGQGKLTKQQIITEIQRTYKTAAEAQGLKISNDVARRSADSIVDNAEQQARKTRLEGNVIYPNHAQDWFGTLFNGILGLGLMRSFGGPNVIKGFRR